MNKRISNIEMIAIFMDWYRDPNHIGYHDIWMVNKNKRKNPPCGFYALKDMQYNKSWDWLMPVVKKINSLAVEHNGSVELIITGSCVYVTDSDGFEYHRHEYVNGEMLAAVYKTVISFVKWYNEGR